MRYVISSRRLARIKLISSIVFCLSLAWLGVTVLFFSVIYVDTQMRLSDIMPMLLLLGIAPSGFGLCLALYWRKKIRVLQ